MKKILSLEQVKQLINNGGFGTYMLRRLVPGEPLVAGSHITSDGATDTSMSTDKLIAHLCEQLDILGSDNYSIELKRSAKSNTPNVVKYMFTTEEEQARQQVDYPSMQGIPADKFEEMVRSRVDQLMELRDKEYKMEREIEEFRRQIIELKKPKRGTKKKNDLMALLPLALAGGSAFIVEKWPNTKETVHKALDAISSYADDDDDDDDDDEEERVQFKRPD
jgi:hypothetical protein